MQQQQQKDECEVTYKSWVTSRGLPQTVVLFTHKSQSNTFQIERACLRLVFIS